VTDVRRDTRDLIAEGAGSGAPGYGDLVVTLATRLIHTPRADVDGAVVDALRALAGFAGADRACVGRAYQDRELVITHEWEAPQVRPSRAILHGLPLTDWPWASAQVPVGEPLGVQPVNELTTRYAELGHRLTAGEIGSVLVLPLDRGARTWLVLCGPDQPRTWDKERTSLLRIAAHMIYGALVADAADPVLCETEERFHQMADAIQTVFWVLQIDRPTFLYVNHAYEKVWGLPRELVHGDPTYFLNVMHPDDRATMEAFYLRCMDHADEIEYRIVFPRDGSTRWHYARAFPLRDAAGRVFRIAGVTDDITERKLAESAARSHQAALAHALRIGTVGELGLGLAHELNQPLSAIASYASGCVRRLRSGNVDAEELARAAEAIAAEAQRAGNIVRALRAHLHAEDPRLESIDIGDLIREALHLVRGEAESGGVSVRCELAAGLPRLRVDRIQLQQVLLNLVCNGIDAITASSRAPRRLTIRTAQVASHEIKVTVVDSGAGFPTDAAEQVFEPFYTTKRNGLGLGLTICRSIVEAHGGRIWAESAAGADTAFHVILPVQS
jgi:PAS domain S-box-containing protein